MPESGGATPVPRLVEAQPMLGLFAFRGLARPRSSTAFQAFARMHLS
jgi:hypothetical protein